MPPHIVGILGPLAGCRFTLGNIPMTFGRSIENIVVIASMRASRHHAELRREGARYVLLDLGSLNGTQVNGRRIRAQQLEPGDVIEIGEEVFRFETTPGTDARTLVAGIPQVSATQPYLPTVGVSSQQPLPPISGSLPPNTFPTSASLLRRSAGLPLLVIGSLIICVFLAGSFGGLAFFTTVRSGGESFIVSTSTSDQQAGIAPAPTRAIPPGAADWTVMVYLDGDNDLEPDALQDYAEMARVGSTERVHILVQLDRIASREHWDDTSNGNWDGARRFRVEQGVMPDPANQLQDLGEVNMGDPRTLADFVEWGVSTYPAQRYALILWDHGAAWPGIASDDTSNGDALTLPELTSALSTAEQRTGFGKLDLIGFDACLMAQIDVFQAIEPYGLVAVGSAELEPNEGWDWDAWLTQLSANPEQTAFDIAPVIVETYIKSFVGTDASDITLSAFDLRQFNGLIERLDRLADAMMTDLHGSYRAIGQARSFVTTYAPSYPEEFNAIDLGHFAQLLPDQGATGAVAAAAQELADAIEQARIANGYGSYHRNSSGLSIYFPQLSHFYLSFYEQSSPLPRQTSWADFLKTYHHIGTTVIDVPTITGLQIDGLLASLNAPITLQGNVAGKDIGNVFSFIGTPNANRDTIQLLHVDFVYPPGSVPGSEPSAWPETSTQLQLNWNATQWRLSNGRDQIGVLLGPIKYGAEFYGIEGIYTSQATGEQTDVGLVFVVNQGQGILVRIWGFPRDASVGEPQPYELRPAAGDTFTAYIRMYTDKGDQLEPGRIQGETITFGDQPLSVALGPAPDGEYVMGFLVRDIAGQFQYDYVDISVSNAGAGKPQRFQ
ncbi:MAG: clostripain-related cysteine peptidase [Chloroflexales bacterium]|nr:clostripain-related cysteine peptidase [Chloroflexales bacterium]